jgi:hypothetical protein
MTDMLELEPEPEMELAIEPEPEPEPETASPLPAVPVALMQVLPADFPLPGLIRFVPDPALRKAVDEASTYALGVEVSGPEGLQRADVAVTALRTSLKAIEDHFEEPVGIANKLHKQLTGVRGEWLERGTAAVRTVGQRIYTEKQRLDAIEREQRRKAQEEADRKAREDARKEAEAAERAKAPARVVEEMKRQAETVTAPPVPVSAPAPKLQGSSTVTTWKARIAGTPAIDEPNPDIEQLTLPQWQRVRELLCAIVEGTAPRAAIQVNWSYLNKRAKADKSTLQIPGIEAFDEGGVRAKGTRAK